MSNCELYLASASPQRQQLLAQLGIQFQCVTVDVDESRLASEQPQQYIKRLSLAKARAGWRCVAEEGVPVLGADTCGEIDNGVLGKPTDQQHALSMLEKLSGNTHKVHTAVAIVLGGREQVCVNTSRVSFRTLSHKERLDYWRSGEPIGKAGAYAIQGKAAAFIQHLEGSYSGVMGLPLFETAQLLSKFGINVIKADK